MSVTPTNGTTTATSAAGVAGSTSAADIVKNVINPPPLIICPDATDSPKSPATHMTHLMLCINEESLKLHREYDMTTGITESGEKIIVKQFVRDLNEYVVTTNTLIEVSDIIAGRYRSFKLPASCESFIDYTAIDYDGVATYVGGGVDGKSVRLYRQGNLPWTGEQQINFDVINLLVIDLDTNGSGVYLGPLWADIWKQLIRIDLFHSPFEPGMYIGSRDIVVGDLYIDVKRVLETEKGVHEWVNIYGNTFHVYRTRVNINGILSRVELSALENRIAMRPDRPSSFVTHVSNRMEGRKKIESLYDAEVQIKLVKKLRVVLIRVFAGMVGRYLTRRFPV